MRDHFSYGRPKLAVGLQELWHVGRAKARVWRKSAKAQICDLLIECFEVEKVCSLAEGKGIAKHSLDAMEPSCGDVLAFDGQFRGIIKNAAAISCVSVRMALWLLASMASVYCLRLRRCCHGIHLRCWPGRRPSCTMDRRRMLGMASS